MAVSMTRVQFGLSHVAWNLQKEALDATEEYVFVVEQLDACSLGWSNVRVGHVHKK